MENFTLIILLLFISKVFNYGLYCYIRIDIFTNKYKFIVIRFCLLIKQIQWCNQKFI